MEKHYPLLIRFRYKYSKSHVRECISWQIGASDYLEVFVISRIFRECNLKPLTASRGTINHEMHEQKQIRSDKYMKCTRSDVIHFSLLFKWQLWEKNLFLKLLQLWCMNGWKQTERNIISCLLTFSAKFTLNFANSKKRDLPLNRIVSKRSVLGAEKVNETQFHKRQ